MAMVTDELIEQMVRQIVNTAAPEQVILFGSHATGSARTDSDLDFLIVESEPFGPARSRRGEMARLWAALASFPVSKDILVYSREEVERLRDSRNHVVARAWREGQTLYERS